MTSIRWSLLVLTLAATTAVGEEYLPQYPLSPEPKPRPYLKQQLQLSETLPFAQLRLPPVEPKADAKPQPTSEPVSDSAVVQASAEEKGALVTVAHAEETSPPETGSEGDARQPVAAIPSESYYIIEDEQEPEGLYQKYRQLMSNSYDLTPHCYARLEALVLLNSFGDYDGDVYGINGQELNGNDDPWHPGVGLGGKFAFGNQSDRRHAWEIGGWATDQERVTFFDSGQDGEFGPIRRPYSNRSLYQPNPPLNGSQVNSIKLERRVVMGDLSASLRHYINRENAQVMRVGFIGGPRIFHFNDRIRDSEYVVDESDSQDADTVYTLRASNTLLGIQGGLAAEVRPSHRLFATGTVQWGIGANSVNATRQLETQDSQIFYFKDSAQEWRTAASMDVQLALIYRLSTDFDVRLGYQAFLLQDMGLATHIAPFNLASSQVDAGSETLLIHGINVGFVLRSAEPRRQVIKRKYKRVPASEITAANAPAYGQTPAINYDTIIADLKDKPLPEKKSKDERHDPSFQLANATLEEETGSEKSMEFDDQEKPVYELNLMLFEVEFQPSVGFETDDHRSGQ